MSPLTLSHSVNETESGRPTFLSDTSNSYHSTCIYLAWWHPIPDQPVTVVRTTGCLHYVIMQQVVRPTLLVALDTL